MYFCTIKVEIISKPAMLQSTSFQFCNALIFFTCKLLSSKISLPINPIGWIMRSHYWAVVVICGSCRSTCFNCRNFKF